MTATTIAPEGAAVRVGSDAFFVWMAFACAVIAFGGFGLEYWASTATGKLAVPAIYHVHGLLFSAWTIFLWCQATFIASGHPARHRRSGLIGISLATAMVFAGMVITISSLQNGIANGFAEEAKTFAVVPFVVDILFAGLLITALVMVADRDTHKRLMLVATINLLEAPIARVFKMFLAPPEIRALPLRQQPPPMLQLTIGPYIVLDLLIVVAMAYDWRTRGRPHPAYLIAGALTVATQLARFVIGPSAAWHSFATWLATVAG
jgi:hypothetical protein